MFIENCDNFNFKFNKKTKIKKNEKSKIKFSYIFRTQATLSTSVYYVSGKKQLIRKLGKITFLKDR